MKKFDSENKSLEAQARRLVSYFDELFFANLQKKHPTEELEGELPARAMRAIVILSNRGRCIMSDFASAVGVPVSTATHMIEKLVRKGLVVRVRSEEDRRVVYVELSEEGRKREHHYLQNRVAMGRDMLGPLSPGERELFLEMLVKMIRATSSESKPTATSKDT
ncbi:MAG TPA: MarR family transcriptional regulator [Candidatus Angelobacter sp.]|jgi:DNA-binding MarR family transcriptional regulator|nr:MarR family transcriptional regulator [Candidatus Angelobacter sp.]